SQALDSGPRRSFGAGIWLSLCHGLIAPDRRNWLILQSDLWHDGSDSRADVLDFRIARYAITYRRGLSPLDRGCRMHCCFKWRNHIAGFKDRLSGRGNALLAAMGDCRRLIDFRPSDRRYLASFEYARNGLQQTRSAAHIIVAAAIRGAHPARIVCRPR